MDFENSPRFSVNSNLMNYSIPRPPLDRERVILSQPPSLSSFDNTKREIQRGDADTRIRQLEAQIEQLTLQNVKLQRMNRLLKIDADNLLEQTTNPLYKTIEQLTIANIKLQRTSRLLQLQLDEKSEQMNLMQQRQILGMKNVGPEYEFLVQNINLLQRQIAGHPTCDETCCFTMKPIDQSSMVMTLPDQHREEDSASSSDEDILEAQHICRPVIHSSISQGSYAVELENKIHRLEYLIEELDQEKEVLLRHQSIKENDVETLKKELKIKDAIVSQLEEDFMHLEDQVTHLHKELATMSSSSDDLMNKLKQQQSQLLMQTKQRRSLVIKDPELLEQLLKSDDEEVTEDDTDENSSTYIESSSRSSSPTSNTAVMYLEDNKKVKRHFLRVMP